MPRTDEFISNPIQCEQHIIYVIDISSDLVTIDKPTIDFINEAMTTATHILSELSAKSSDTAIKISVMGFHETAKWFTPFPINAENFSWQPLSGSGSPNLSDALVELACKLDTEHLLKTTVPFRTPVIVFINNNTPKLSKTAIDELKKNTWYKSAIKLAIAFNNHDTLSVYYKLFEDSESVIAIRDVYKFKKILTCLSATIIPQLINNQISPVSIHTIRQVLQKELNLSSLTSEPSTVPKEYFSPNATVTGNPIDISNPYTRASDSYGRAKCRLLKTIRKSVADANSIPYEITECTSKNPCSGTCPYCDSEAMELSKRLSQLASDGKTIHMPTMDTDSLDHYLPSQTPPAEFLGGAIQITADPLEGDIDWSDETGWM